MADLDAATRGDVGRATASKEFTGRLYDIFMASVSDGMWRARRVALIGGGKQADFEPDVIRRLAAAGGLFARQRRIKLWGRARVVEDDPALLARLSDRGYRARPERAILFTLEAWDVNCSQHITARFSEDEVAQATAPLLERIASLETENARLRAAGLATAVSEPAGARAAAP